MYDPFEDTEAMDAFIEKYYEDYEEFKEDKSHATPEEYCIRNHLRFTEFADEYHRNEMEWLGEMQYDLSQENEE